MSWIGESYMGQEAVARDREGKTHLLNKEVQGEYPYMHGPYAKPVLAIRPGGIVVAETEEALVSAIKTEMDLPCLELRMPFVNPQFGPIVIEGAEPGDVLCVNVRSILPRASQPAGTSALIPKFGGLVSNGQMAMLSPPVPSSILPCCTRMPLFTWATAMVGRQTENSAASRWRCRRRRRCRLISSRTGRFPGRASKTRTS